MPTAEELTSAFELGSRAADDTAAIQPPLTYKMESSYDEPAEANRPDTACATKAMAATVKLPGQQWDTTYTTLYNPLPSDPKVEKVLGERRYKAKPNEDSIEAMRIKMHKMEAQLGVLLGGQTDAPAETDTPTEPAAAPAPTPTRRKR